LALLSSWPGSTRPSSRSFRVCGGRFWTPGSSPGGDEGREWGSRYRPCVERPSGTGPGLRRDSEIGAEAAPGYRRALPSPTATAQAGALPGVMNSENAFLFSESLGRALVSPLVMAGLDPAIQPKLSRVRRAFLNPRVKPSGDKGREWDSLLEMEIRCPPRVGRPSGMGPGLRRDSEIGVEAAPGYRHALPIPIATPAQAGVQPKWVAACTGWSLDARVQWSRPSSAI